MDQLFDVTVKNSDTIMINIYLEKLCKKLKKNFKKS